MLGSAPSTSTCKVAAWRPWAHLAEKSLGMMTMPRSLPAASWAISSEREFPLWMVKMVLARSACSKPMAGAPLS